MSKRRILHRRPLFDEETVSMSAPRDHADDVDSAGDDDIDAEFAHLYAYDSDALTRWKDRLSGYVDLQGTLDALRLRPSTEQPWPAFDNPMLGYLKERAAEIAARDGADAAITWLAANAWFEGSLAERSRFFRLLD